MKLSGELISVSIDGRGAAWCDGIFSGDEEIVEMARNASIFSLEVDVMGIPIQADSDSTTGALAALYAYSPGRTILIQAPDDIFDILDHQASLDEPELWSA
ncbi:hypothetical protein GCM10025867_48580 (plasmid) [Frondihabitans sucicola]|uniref:STAS domain-containing protein n=1 Tax=Frondihabitans sucicola TaxID=1268041 RepID=A0ABN6Y5K9_9MICO|nr:hypothetical protein GCM10025867_48580 [Frondihabitans sucicola]